MPADDFAELRQAAKTLCGDRPDNGKKQACLKSFETLPNLMLNAHGLAKYIKTSDREVFIAMSTVLKSGAMYVTEYASSEAECRGIAATRWLKPL